MPTDEQAYQAQLNQGRRQEQEQSEGGGQPAGGQVQAPAVSVSFPWGMLFVALLFDLIGIIPIINIFTEILASLIMWFWQKAYVPQLDAFLNIIVNKIIDLLSLGLLPSNIFIVVVAYIRKRVHAEPKSAFVRHVAGQSAT